MSGLAAILPAADPAPLAHLQRMLSASAHRGPHGTSSWRSDDGPALGYLSFETVHGPSAERQPLVDDRRRLAFVFDGRLDNREDVASALGLRSAELSDARLAFEAFAAWGPDAAERLLGDFAWIGWDGLHRRLVGARDHLGIRPLHYCPGDGVFLCATDIAQILAHPSAPRQPDLSTVAEFLALDPPNTGSTLFRGIHRVPPGHVLVVSEGTTSLRQYWTPEPRDAIRFADDRDYAARCRELLVRSVDCRLRSAQPVAALLSGGVDSSSVVTIASRILSQRSAPLTPFSLVFPGRAEADERQFITDVADRCQVAPVLLEPSRVAAGDLWSHATRWNDCPGFAADFAVRGMYDAIHASGHEVVLTGCGGDFLFSGSVFQYADLLRQLRVVAAVRQFVADSRAHATGWSALGLVQAGVWPLLPLPVKRTLRPLARRVAGIHDRPEWLRLPRQVQRRHPDEPRGGSFAAEDVTRDLTSGLHSLILEAGERVLSEVPLETRHPLMDVRLVDFALSIPEEQRRRGTLLKVVLRNALQGELPPSVATRRTKGAFGHVVVDALEALGGEAFFASLQMADAGWVDGGVVSRQYAAMHRRFQAGEYEYRYDLPALWMVAAMELWFAATFGPAASGVTPVAERAIMGAQEGANG